MIDHLTRVVLDAVDERRLAPPQHGQSEGVQAGAVDDAAVVAELALRVDDGHVEPPVVGPKARRPDDRADLAAAEVELATGAAGASVGAKRSGASTSASSPLVRAHSSNTSSSRSILRSASEQTLRSPPENSARPSRTVAQRPTSSTPIAGERVEVERRPLGRPDELRRRQPPRPREILDLVVAAGPTRRTRPSTTARRGRGTSAASARAPRPTGSPADPIASARRRAARRSPTPRRRARRPRGAGPGCGSRTASAARRPPARRARSSGTVGRLQAPLAMTTARDRISPRLVVTWYPSSVRRTEVTFVPVRTGARARAAKRSMSSIDLAPSSCSRRDPRLRREGPAGGSASWGSAVAASPSARAARSSPPRRARARRGRSTAR